MSTATTPSALSALAARLVKAGEDAGLAAVGVAGSAVFESTLRDLLKRKAAGIAASMAFTYRNPERSTDPSRIVAGARALLVGAMGYPATESGPPPGGPWGRVARYSRRDEYARLRSALEVPASLLREEGFRARVVADDNALVDREAARRAGIGWYGKNSMMLIPRRGSWFLLGSVVTDAPLPPNDRKVREGCGSCTRCISACPTGAIVEPGVVDARRCLAWLLQDEGDFPLEHRVALGDRIYGCDECQVVCPPNRSAERGRALVRREGDEAWVDLVDVIMTDDAELMERFGRWYIAGREPRYLRRNALVALGNCGDGDDARVEGALRWALSQDDLVLASHAAWAASRLGRDDLVGSPGLARVLSRAGE